jgi:hypothetical protein
MDNVVNFPSEQVRDWIEISKSFRESMAAEGVSQECIIWILEDLKPRMDHILYGGEPHEQAGRFLTQILQLEAQLYKALHEG